MEIRNAVIKSASMNTSDFGVLTVWLTLDYGGSCQSFGGFSLYLPKSFSNHQMMSPAGHFIWRCMEIADVTSWEKLVGKTIRVKLDKPGLGGRILSIGHIVKDDWFDPEFDFAAMREAA